MQNNNCSCCGQACDTKVDSKILDVTKASIEKFKHQDGALIPVLHAMQDQLGYLPEEGIKLVSEGLNIPVSEIYGVATFYSFFSLEPKGEYVIRVCIGTACYVKGAQQLLDKLSDRLNVEVGATTEDGKFTIEGCRCIGACGLAPVLTINDKVYGKLKVEDIDGILDEYVEK